MPGFDRTGPRGAGPMTGGARGQCYSASAGYNPRFSEGFGYGRGLGRGFRGGFGPGRGQGRGFGRGYGWYPPDVGPGTFQSAAEEIDMLKADAEFMQKSLDAVNERLKELDQKASGSS